MKVRLLVLFILSFSVLCFSQTPVTMSADWQINNTLTGSCYAGCYNPATDHFLVSVAGAAVNIYSGSDGSDTATTLNVSSVPISGLGIFGMGATVDGVIYAYNDGDGGLYRWDNESAATATVALAGASFARTMDVHGTGVNTIIALIGSGISFPIDILGTTDGLTFTLLDQTAGIAKNGGAVNDALDKAWGTPDCPGAIPLHAIKSGGVWATESTVWLPPGAATGSTIMDYDDRGDILVACNPNTSPRTIIALDGTSGSLSASVDDTTVATNGVNCYGGLYIDKANGKVYYTQRGVAPDVNMGRLTYTPLLPTKALDWSVYE